MDTRVRLAVAGFGNSARAFTSFVQSAKAGGKEAWHSVVGGLKISDLELVAAFDIDSKKVGKSVRDLCKMGAGKEQDDMEFPNVEIDSGLLEDELPGFLSREIKSVASEREDFSNKLRKAKPDVLLIQISSGIDGSVRAYAKEAIESRVSVINATPTLLASDMGWAKEFRDANLVLAGDDLMSQLGGTALHRGLLSFLRLRGVQVKRSYQLDVGGSLETLNTMDERVREIKKQIKSSSIQSEVDEGVDTTAGTTDYVDFMGDRRVSHIWVDTVGPMTSEYELDIYLKSRDGPNAVNTLCDVTRAVAFLVRSGYKGAHEILCAYGFKKPPKPLTVEKAVAEFEGAFVRTP